MPFPRLQKAFERHFRLVHLIRRLRTMPLVHSMPFLQRIILYIILSILAQPSVAQQTWVEINQSPTFQVLPLCAGLCLQDPATYVDVRSGIGCPAVPYGQNECYCRADLKLAASSYITAA